MERDRIVEHWDELPAAEKAGRLAAVGTALSAGPLTWKEATRGVATELGLEDSQVLPFITGVDLLALARRGPST